MNSAGCTQPHGNSIAFRLPCDRVLLVPARLCKKAIHIFDDKGSVDVMSACTSKHDYQNWAVLVDSAARLGKWRNVANGTEFKIRRMLATSTWDNPSDSIETVAPNLPKSQFERAKVRWQQSPERLLPFKRRAKQKTQGEPFEFDIKYGPFNLK